LEKESERGGIRCISQKEKDEKKGNQQIGGKKKNSTPVKEYDAKKNNPSTDQDRGYRRKKSTQWEKKIPHRTDTRRQFSRRNKWGKRKKGSQTDSGRRGKKRVHITMETGRKRRAERNHSFKKKGKKRKSLVSKGRREEGFAEMPPTA